VTARSTLSARAAACPDPRSRNGTGPLGGRARRQSWYGAPVSGSSPFPRFGRQQTGRGQGTVAPMYDARFPRSLGADRLYRSAPIFEISSRVVRTRGAAGGSPKTQTAAGGECLTGARA